MMFKNESIIYNLLPFIFLLNNWNKKSNLKKINIMKIYSIGNEQNEKQ